MKLPSFNPPLSARWASLSPGQKCVFPLAALVVGAIAVAFSPVILAGYAFIAWEDFWDGPDKNPLPFPPTNVHVAMPPVKPPRTP